MPIARDEPLRQERAQKIAEECYADVLAYCRRHAPAGHEAADLAQAYGLELPRLEHLVARGGKVRALHREAISFVCAHAQAEALFDDYFRGVLE